MSKWSKTPEETVALFNECLPQDPRVERRKMFGFPCALVNNNMFTGTFEDQIMIRLPPEEQAQVLAEGGSGFAPMGRRMKEYVSLSPERAADDGYVTGWMDRSFAYASALPPKIKKPRKKRAKKKA